MSKFDHLTLPVSNWLKSRDWYVRHLGLKVEFEIPERHTAALQDEDDFTIFVLQPDAPVQHSGIALYFQVADVEAIYAQLSAAGVHFTHSPQRVLGDRQQRPVDATVVHARLQLSRHLLGGRRRSVYLGRVSLKRTLCGLPR